MTDDIIKNQATINIGTIGHVAHGKSTLVRQISGVTTFKYKSELERNITIKLGYANAKIYECNSPECPRPDRYKSFGSNAPEKVQCPRRGCSGTLLLVRHVSFVDCPGHDVLMATMLNGTAIMDSALLLIAANETCPQPQTQEHLFAVEIMRLENLIIVQNKIDLLTREQAIQQSEQIKKFIYGTKIKNAPVVPASSQLGVNVDSVLDFIVNYIPVPDRDIEAHPRMVIIRSFDVNKPGCLIDDLQGGVIGGSLVTGRICLGDRIEIRPGVIERNGNIIRCKPFISKIVSLKTEDNKLEHAVPGGLIGVGTNMDPVYCRADKLVGQVMGLKGKMPDIYIEIQVEYILFEKITLAGRLAAVDVGVLKVREQMLLNIGSTTTGCFVVELNEKVAVFRMMLPACCEIGERIAISRKINNYWRLIGYGSVSGGKIIEPEY